VFDLPDGSLRSSGRLLRIRSEGELQTLTYKGPSLPSRHKRREELEAPTSSRALAKILDRLGYVPCFRYEKFRTTFLPAGSQNSAAGVVALDETPIGAFLELEGPEDWIDETASTLGFGPRDYITKSYASLYREHLERIGGPPDMTF
jgi:adenylate cyclase class 2